MKARKKAWEILIAVLQQGKYANLMMRTALTDLSEKDKALATELVYGCLRNYRYLSFQFRDLLRKKTAKEIEILLAMSIYQFWFLDKIPDYAVISEAVEIIKQSEFSFAGGMVNAVLRAVVKQGKLETSDLAVRYSYPRFIIGLVRKQYNDTLLYGFLKANNQSAKLILRANELKSSTATLLADPEFQSFYGDSLIYKKDIINSPYYQRGEVIIQDASSQLVASWLPVQAGDRVLDVAAAPGSKTAQLAAMMKNQGEIVALDIHEHRLKLMTESMKRLGVINVKTLLLDGRKVGEHFPVQSFDHVLFDAPCSGLGVLKRKPEIKYRLKKTDLEDLAKLQKEILSAIAPLVKVNGTLTYSTCTVNLAENQWQIEAFLALHSEYSLVKQQTIWPNNQHDGFYLAQLLRVS